MKSVRSGFVFLRLFFIFLLIAQPIFAERPPDGYARPPIHFRPFAASGPSGFTPQQIWQIYGFDQVKNQGEGETIAIVDAFDDPNIQRDLAVFSQAFGLPPCDTTACFEKVYASGKKPRTDAGWALEIALDVEWAHAIAPKAKILLVEAASNSFADLLQAVNVAVQRGAAVVSMSWGGSEFSSESSYSDQYFTAAGVTFTASSGDSGNGAEFPAASPFVVAVGGTTLATNGTETAWSGSGGGLSAYVVEPLYQATYPIPNNPNGKRGIPDVAYNGNPNTGFPVYDSVRYQGQSGWFQVGGTSAGAPQWAALFAIANSVRTASGKSHLSNANIALYSAAKGSNTFYDVTTGTNGNCGTICTATAGYDYVTGLGSPNAAALIPALVAQ
jgi:subtilase family serine protease